MTMNTREWRPFGLVLLLASLAGGCQTERSPSAAPPSPAPGAQRAFQVRGVVQEVRAADRSVRVTHEEIPGYMAAMTMPFDVQDPAELDGLSPGDRIAFRLNVTETEGWIDQVKVLESGLMHFQPAVTPGARRARDVEELAEGDLLPDYPFISEQGRRVRLSEYRGQALGLTFIYTRCPYPTFCPRQSRQFVQVCRILAQQAGAPDNWRLLSITFDPAFDTPARLQQYGRGYGQDPSRWSFLTGELIDIDAITEQFGMFFGRDGQGFSHNVRTVVVDATGRIQRIFVGNDWTAEEVAAELVKGAAQR
ncbi:MAG: electron transporter SenC [Verrucomicrobia bacterium]|nr:electron transporter SenC [Verrucomicrobiota bacterium]